MKRWSLIDDKAFSGAVNMAVDEYLLDKAENGHVSPVLRLYSFSPPAVTIGFHQDPVRIVDMGSLARDGIDLVRRITGGRALLHAGELTYSVTAPLGPPFFPGGLQKTFLDISKAIVNALKSVGVDAGISNGRPFSRGESHSSPCLVSTSRHEVSVGGRKIMGSAQRRTASAFLQHGSILLRPASDGIVDYLKGDWKDISSMITSVEEETGNTDVDVPVRKALIDSFAGVFGIGFDEMSISGEGLTKIASGAKTKAAEFMEQERSEGTG
ncbi:MAG: lipoate--protein ligase family protein [Bacteroidales bacterium]|nr:lipoate--protein ligase family protein [Candidatus Latescibacterota bacterium]